MADQKSQGDAFSGQISKTIADFEPTKKPKRNKYALACAFLAAMTSALLGYDIGVMSGAQIYIQKDFKLSDFQIEILSGILNWYSLLGSAAAGRTSDWIGRRLTIVFACAIFFAGALLMGFATNYAFLMVGRFVAGVGVGYGVIAPVYTAELSPASCRGFLTSFPEVSTNIGILLGYVSNYAFSKLPHHLGWRFMLGAGAVPPIFLVIGILSMPESPRWLVMQGRLGDAKRVLDRTSDSPEESRQRLGDIKQAAGIPDECNDDIVTMTKQHRGEGVWRDLLLRPTASVRHILLASLGIHFLQQASGIDSVVIYSPRIFEKAGIKNDNDKLLATVAVGFIKTMFILVAVFLLDRVGRRKLILTSMGGMTVTLLLLGTGLTIIDRNPDHKIVWAVILCVTMVLAYVSFFSVGMGPIPWVYTTEIFPLRLRAQGCGLAMAVNRLTSGLIQMTFLSLYSAITIGGSFILYAVIAGAAFAFFYALLPETQGRILEDTEVLFGTFFKWKSALKELENNPPEKRQAEAQQQQLQMSVTTCTTTTTTATITGEK